MPYGTFTDLESEHDTIVEFDTSRMQLERYLLQCGLWSRRPQDGAENTHFVLSPCALRLSRETQRELQVLSQRTYAALRELNGTLVACARGEEADARGKRNQALLLKLAKLGSRSLTTPEFWASRGEPPALPPAIKVDLIRREDGRYRIAEVDVYNPRGFGYLALLDGMAPEGAPRYPGIGKFAEILREQASEPDPVWFIIVSEYERYYEPAFRILAEALGRRGISACIVRERELAENEHALRVMTHAIIIPESLHKYPQVRERLLERFSCGCLTLLYPPSAYLGSKAFLPMISEHKKMNRHVPKSKLVSRQLDPLPLMGDAPLVIKGTVSSGMKEVFLSSEDPVRFLKALRSARTGKTPRWIVQEEVPQRPFDVSVFNEHGAREVQKHFIRLTAYITEDGVLGAEVTGRPSKMVHGAKDCIQIPCVLG